MWNSSCRNIRGEKREGWEEGRGRKELRPITSFKKESGLRAAKMDKRKRQGGPGELGQTAKGEVKRERGPKLAVKKGLVGN